MPVSHNLKIRNCYLNAYTYKFNTKVTPPTTNYWLQGQGKLAKNDVDLEKPIKLLDNTNLEILSIHSDHKGSENENASSGHISIRLLNGNLNKKESVESLSSIVATILNNKELFKYSKSAWFDNYFVKYPLHYKDLIKTDGIRISKNEEDNQVILKSKIYDVWYDSVFANRNIKDSKEKLCRYLLDKGHDEFSQHIERSYNNYAAIKENDFNHWYTLFLDNYTKSHELGTFMMLSVNELPEWTLTIVYDYVKIIYERIRRIESRLKLEHQAKKSALAAVMSRNMSHNIGSHSLDHLGNKNIISQILGGDYKVIPRQLVSQGTDSNPLSNKGYESDSRFLNDRNKLKEGNEIASILLSEYFKNIRIRMDLIADLVTSVPTSETTKCLKYDVLQKFKNNYFLVDTISGVTRFEYSLSLNHRNIAVSIPNDILGMDAFSILIENIVRNSAKHAGVTNQVNYKIKVEDNVFPEYWKVTIYDDLQRNIKLVKTQNENINLRILDKYNKLRKSAWGMLEMKVASAYLRKIPIEEIDDDEYQLKLNKDGSCRGNLRPPKNKDLKKVPYLIKATLYPYKNPVGFGYTFYLMKPKEVAISVGPCQ